MSSYYPPSPSNVPRDFTRPPASYRNQVVLVLASLIVTLAIYLTMVIGCGWLCYKLVTVPWPPRAEGGYLFVRIVLIICSGLLFLYLLKGLFKGSRQDQSLLLEITEKEQPELFEFIRQVCTDTRSIFPYKIYLTPDVNAAVFYHSSFLNLFFPTPKNLLIGLGLVNMLNMSEFKAVLAHEFGHFSQKSMKLGTYVYMANKILADVIYGRDFLDNAVNRLKYLDLRIAIFVWVFIGILWVLRKILEGVFKVINIFNLSLMRQMEFNADRQAVSVAGSDAIVHGLLKSSYADQAFRQLGNDLWSAADHKLYSSDIFLHQIQAGELMRKRTKNPNLGKPPTERGQAVQVFKPGEGELNIPLMWSTHPSNIDREANAKAEYIPCVIDERSPWILFRDQSQLRRRVSLRYYQVFHKPPPPIQMVDALTVQSFLNAEYAETTYPEHYLGFYDNRYLEIADLDPLLHPGHRDTIPAYDLTRVLHGIFGPDLKKWVEEHNKRLDDFNLLAGLKAGQLTLKNKTLEFRGQNYRPTEVQSLLDMVQKELDEDQKYKTDVDARVILCQLGMLRKLGLSEHDLVRRYRFQLTIQNMLKKLTFGLQDAQNALNFAGSKRELTPEEFAQLRSLFQQVVGDLHEILRESDRLSIPALKNIAEGEPLRPFLLTKPLIANLSAVDNSISPQWIQQFMAQIGEVQDKLKRLYFKSLGGILTLQEKIEADWMRQDAGA